MTKKFKNNLKIFQLRHTKEYGLGIIRNSGSTQTNLVWKKC